MTSESPIESRIKELIAEGLAIDDINDIHRESRFFADLDGAESLDLLDLGFRCSKEFGRPIRFEEFYNADLFRTDEEGRLLPEAIEAIRAKYPFLDMTPFEQAEPGTPVQDFLTVDVIIRIVEHACATVESEVGG